MGGRVEWASGEIVYLIVFIVIPSYILKAIADASPDEEEMAEEDNKTFYFFNIHLIVIFILYLLLMVFGKFSN